MDTGYCPSCDTAISFATQPIEGTTTVCPKCKDDLIVIGTSPIELDWPDTYDDDDDEDDDDY